MASGVGWHQARLPAEGPRVQRRGGGGPLQEGLGWEPPAASTPGSWRNGCRGPKGASGRRPPGPVTPLQGFTPAPCNGYVGVLRTGASLGGPGFGMWGVILDPTRHFLQTELAEPELRPGVQKGCREPIPSALLRAGPGAPPCHSPRDSTRPTSGRNDKAVILSLPRGGKARPHTQLFLNILNGKSSLEFESRGSLGGPAV